MAQIHICDGCGKSADLVRVGFMRNLEYCQECKEAAEAFIAEVDAAHEEAAELFKAKFEAAKAKYSLTEHPY